jgi:hypothetical protein
MAILGEDSIEVGADYESGGLRNPPAVPGVRFGYAVWLSNTAFVDFRSDDRRPAIVRAGGDIRSWFVKFPARRLVSARSALEEHPILFELEHAVVAVQPAESFTNPVEHAFSKPFRLRGLRGTRRDSACRPQ